MVAIKHILCPTDLSDESEAALRYAITLARTYKAKLMIYHCAPASMHLDGLMCAELKNRIEASVRKWTGIGNCSLAEYEGVVVQGDPVEAITMAAAGWRTDLIVMRSRRRPKA
ncbi:MAG: universal stress protein [Acidobacteria bacterium]|nr:universal stress protein [Acidobacteriota bacterium]